MTELRFPPGRIVGGRFTIQAELGRGPGSVTYRAITAPNREVAVRVLDPEVPNATALVHALQEAHSRLRTDLGRFVTAIVESGRDAESGAPFLVVPLVMTPSLAQLVALCPFEPADAAAMIVSLGRALDTLHAAGLPHLALKPTNVFVGPAPDRSVQLTDAGLHLLHGGARGARGAVGEWIAPEQAGAPDTTGPAADVFSMALVAFYALTGTTLLPSSSVEDRRAALAGQTLVSDRLRQLGITLPPGLDAVLARGLAVAPADRPPSAGAFAEALASALSGAPPIAPAITEARAPVPVAPAITEAPEDPIAPAITEPAPPLVGPEPVATASDRMLTRAGSTTSSFRAPRAAASGAARCGACPFGADLPQRFARRFRPRSPAVIAVVRDRRIRAGRAPGATDVVLAARMAIPLARFGSRRRRIRVVPGRRRPCARALRGRPWRSEIGGRSDRVGLGSRGSDGSDRAGAGAGRGSRAGSSRRRAGGRASAERAGRQRASQCCAERGGRRAERAGRRAERGAHVAARAQERRAAGRLRAGSLSPRDARRKADARIPQPRRRPCRRPWGRCITVGSRGTVAASGGAGERAKNTGLHAHTLHPDGSEEAVRKVSSSL